VFALLALAVFVAADPSPVSSATAFTPQEKVLAQAPYGNFACRVNSLKLTIDSPGVGEHIIITPDEVRAAFANVATLEWAHIAQSSFSSLDGRNEEKVLATPGGDMGEFIQALEAYTKVSGKTLDAAEVQRVFEKYLKVMTRQKFSYETDEKAYIRLAVATGCKNLHVSEMGGMKHKREAFLSQMARPEHIGDAFIRFLATNATELTITPDYIHHALAAYHNVLWTTPSRLSTKLCYLELKGAHLEAALINIRTPPFCVDQGLAPMVSQQLTCSAPALVNHPEAVRVLRRELVSVLSTLDAAVDAKEVMAAFNLLAEANLEKFWGEVGQDLPVYTVEFVNSSPLLSTEEEFVE